MPRIVSGTSGGAIVAGVLAVNTDQEGRLLGISPRDEELHSDVVPPGRS